MGQATFVRESHLNGNLGLMVKRVAALDIAASTPIFQILGGYVQVTGLYGFVTVLHAGGANTIQFRHSVGPTVISTATPAVASPVGTIYSCLGDPASPVAIGVGTGVLLTAPPVQGGMKGAGASGIQQMGLVCGIGTIDVTFSVVTAGSTRYVLTYIPIDELARVIAV